MLKNKVPAKIIHIITSSSSLVDRVNQVRLATFIYSSTFTDHLLLEIVTLFLNVGAILLLGQYPIHLLHVVTEHEDGCLTCNNTVATTPSLQGSRSDDGRLQLSIYGAGLRAGAATSSACVGVATLVSG